MATTYIPVNNVDNLGNGVGGTGNQLAIATGGLGGGLVSTGTAWGNATGASPIQPLPGTGVAGDLTVGYPG